MEKGFTIIELAISIFILSVAIVGIFSAFSVTTILTSDSADRLTGTYLAQEGMEIIRNIRDTNWLNANSSTWLDGLDLSACSSGQGCEVDYTESAPHPWSYGTQDYLKINSAGFYVYDSEIPSHTKFKRMISILPTVDANNQQADHIVLVTVAVSWDEKATILNPSGFSADICHEGRNCIIVEETLYDWYNYSPAQ